MAKHVHIHFAPRKRIGDQAPGSVPPSDLKPLVEALHAAIAAREGATPTKDADFDESKVKRDEGGRFSAQQHEAAAAEHKAEAEKHDAAYKATDDPQHALARNAHQEAGVHHAVAAKHVQAQTGWSDHNAQQAHNATALAKQMSAKTAGSGSLDQLKATASDPKASIEQRAAAVAQLSKMEKMANEVAASPHAISQAAQPSQQPVVQAPAGGAAPQAQPATAKPTSAKASGAKAATHELLSSGHPFSVDELMKATNCSNRTTLMTALSDLKSPKYAGKLGALNIVKRPDGMYHVQKDDGKPLGPVETPPGYRPEPKPLPSAVPPGKGNFKPSSSPDHDAAVAWARKQNGGTTTGAPAAAPSIEALQRQIMEANRSIPGNTAAAVARRMKIIGPLNNQIAALKAKDPSTLEGHLAQSKVGPDGTVTHNGSAVGKIEKKTVPSFKQVNGAPQMANKEVYKATHASGADLGSADTMKEAHKRLMQHHMQQAKPSTSSGPSTGQRDPGEKFAGALARKPGEGVKRGPGGAQAQFKSIWGTPNSVLKPKDLQIRSGQNMDPNMAVRSRPGPSAPGTKTREQITHHQNMESHHRAEADKIRASGIGNYKDHLRAAQLHANAANDYANGKGRGGWTPVSAGTANALSKNMGLDPLNSNSKPGTGTPKMNVDPISHKTSMPGMSTHQGAVVQGAASPTPALMDALHSAAGAWSGAPIPRDKVEAAAKYMHGKAGVDILKMSEATGLSVGAAKHLNETRKAHFASGKSTPALTSAERSERMLKQRPIGLIKR